MMRLVGRVLLTVNMRYSFVWQQHVATLVASPRYAELASVLP